MTFAAAVGRRRRWPSSASRGAAAAAAAAGGPIARPIPVACLGILASLCFFGVLFQRHNALTTMLPMASRDSEESPTDAKVPIAPVSPSNGDAAILVDTNGGDARTDNNDHILSAPMPSRFHNYTNLPVNEETDESRAKLRQLLSESVPPPVGLRHQASPPGHDAILGLAAYPKNMGTWRRLVGSLRNTGYDGHIIFGVHSVIPQEEEVYLKEMDVTYYEVEFVDCDESILVGGANAGKDAVRTKCAKGYEQLTLEWGRFEMARRWLHACEQCTGWNLVMDTRDVFFQAHPFASLPSAATVDGTKNDDDDDNDNRYADGVANLLFIEEIAAHSSPVAESHRYFQLDNPRYSSRTVPCYGRNHMRRFAHRPVLCSGTIVGTRNGMHRFLSVLVDEFKSNNRGEKGACKNSVRGLTDQWTMNYLYYTGRFGDYSRTKSVPWGSGPVMTIGKPCINNALRPNITHSQKDLIDFQGDNGVGLIRNSHEGTQSKARIAPVVHQYDRCHRWIQKWFRHHPELFEVTPKLAWK